MSSTSMTSRERLLAAYRREEVDRLPVYLWGFWPYLDEDGALQLHVNSLSGNRPHLDDNGELQIYADNLSGDLLPELKEYVWHNADLVALWFVHDAAEYFCFYHALNTYGHAPNLYGAFKSFCFGRAFEAARVVNRQLDGGSILQEVVLETPRGPLVEQRLTLSSGRSEIVKHYVSTEDELQRFLSLPYKPPPIDFDVFFDFRDKLGDRGIVRPHLSDAVHGVYLLFGTETLAYWSKDKRSTVRALLDTFQDRLLAVIRQCGEAGIKVPVMVGGQWVCLPPLHSPRDFEEFVVQYDREAMDLCHSYGMQVVTSCHTDQPLKVLDLFVEMGVDVLNGPIYQPWSDITPKDLRDRLSSYIAIEGGVALADIYSLDRAGLEERLRYALEASHDGRGLILTMDASPLVGTPLTRELADNFRSILDFAHRTHF